MTDAAFASLAAKAATACVKRQLLGDKFVYLLKEYKNFDLHLAIYKTVAYKYAQL